MSKNRTNFPFFVIGLDIGGTKIGGAILEYSDEKTAPKIIFEDKDAAEAKSGSKTLVANACGLANKLKEKAIEKNPEIPVLAIGIGCAGRINKTSGKVETATDNFPDFGGYPLTKTVSESIGLPVFALNDVQAHTLGEARWGAGRGSDNFVLLAIGTGIGGCAVINGSLLLGSHGYAGELGHAQVNLGHDIACTCGKAGHLEAVASGSGIERIYKSKTGNELSGPEISKLANDGDEAAKETIELAGRCLGRIIATYLSIFDPEKIILGGSVIKSGPVWQDALDTGFKEEVIGEIADNLNLCEAKLGDSAPLIGAAEYALDRLGE